MSPQWLSILSIVSLFLGFVAALIIVFDEFRHPQRMWIMDVVWPVTALFGSLLICGAISHTDATDKASSPGD